MRIVFLSDTHGLHDAIGELPEGDVLVHSGDMENSGRKIYDVQHYAKWLSGAASNFSKIIQIAGNHDGSFEKYRKEAEGLLHTYNKNLVYLENESYTHDGIKFWGSPNTPEFFDWYFMKQRGQEINEVWLQIPEDTDVLITHGPALGYLDSSSGVCSRVGCEDLLYRVREVNPIIHASGHIHGAYGTINNGDTFCVNASICTERYHPYQQPIVVDLDTETKDVRLVSEETE